MANKDQPQGFRPYGEPRRTVALTAGARVFPGDCVTMQSDGKVDPSAAGNDILGVALTYADADGDTVKVSTDPEQIYVAQGDGSDFDAQTDIGNICDILATAGNTTYRQSRQELDSSTVGTGSGGQFVIVALRPGSDNAFGANAEVLCKINEMQLFGENDFAGV